MNAILERERTREIKGLALARHSLRLLVLIVNVLIRSERLIAILLDLLYGFLALVLALFLAKVVILAIVGVLRLVLQFIFLLNLPLLLAELRFLEGTLF